MPIKKKLIMGVIENYSWEMVEAFVTSYKKSAIPNSQCIMFVRNIAENVKKKIEGFRCSSN